MRIQLHCSISKGCCVEPQSNNFILNTFSANRNSVMLLCIIQIVVNQFISSHSYSVHGIFKLKTTELKIWHDCTEHWGTRTKYEGLRRIQNALNWIHVLSRIWQEQEGKSMKFYSDHVKPGFGSSCLLRDELVQDSSHESEICVKNLIKW